MPMIRECIVTTLGPDGLPHLAPLGLIAEGDDWIIAPFRPSATLDNLAANPRAIANYLTDVRIFAGCLTGRRNWPLVPTGCGVPRLAAALSHAELEVVAVSAEVERPRFRCRVAREDMHAPFAGFNRAQNAVLEGAILVSRLHMLPKAEIVVEMARLETAVRKTAGMAEIEAWAWLMDKVHAHDAA